MATSSESAVNFEKFDFDSATTDKNFIDKGAFGEVYGPFTWNGRRCALKRIRLSSGKPGDDLRKKVKDKKSIWTSLRHKNLMEIYSVILKPKTLYFVLEFASGGSLRHLLDNSDVTFRRQIHVSHWAGQIVEGMLYLHEEDVVHRDLKSSNIMLMEPFDVVDSHKKMTIKIADFDEVREFDHTTTMSLRGTCAYTAPEVLQSERFSKASDVWSYGVVLWEMLTGELPHKDLQEGAILLKALAGQLSLFIPESIPKAFQELLRECLHYDTKSRPTFCKILDRLNSIDNSEDKLRRENKLDPVLVDQKLEQDRKAKEELSKRLEDERTLREQLINQIQENMRLTAEIRYKLDPVSVQAIRTKASEEEKKWIRGMTILDKELFVVSQRSSEVEVYDSMKFSFSRRWNLKDLIHPEDMRSCNRNKCLYIFDYKGFCGNSSEILRVDPNGKLIKNWSTGDDFGQGLSVTDESNVILSVYEKSKLNEYSSDGQLIREINLSSDAGILKPLHAIKLTSGHFLVSHGGYGRDLQRVCAVDGDGILKKSFGGKRGSTMGQMNYPVYLATGGNGFVMIADFNNSRVLLLDSDLECKKEILSKEKNGLRLPTRILLDESNGRLFVADKEISEGGRILIFEFN